MSYRVCQMEERKARRLINGLQTMKERIHHAYENGDDDEDLDLYTLDQFVDLICEALDELLNDDNFETAIRLVRTSEGAAETNNELANSYAHLGYSNTLVERALENIYYLLTECRNIEIEI